MRSLLRHQRAYQVVMGWSRPVLDKAVDLAQGYPIDLRTSGTMQVLAFSMSKREPGHAAMTHAIADWVLSAESGGSLGALEAKDRTVRKLLQSLAEAGVAQYAAADAEAIAFADALKLVGKAVKGGG